MDPPSSCSNRTCHGLRRASEISILPFDIRTDHSARVRLPSMFTRCVVGSRWLREAGRCRWRVRGPRRGPAPSHFLLHRRQSHLWAPLAARIFLPEGCLFRPPSCRVLLRGVIQRSLRVESGGPRRAEAMPPGCTGRSPPSSSPSGLLSNDAAQPLGSLRWQSREGHGVVDLCIHMPRPRIVAPSTAGLIGCRSSGPICR